ncbi:hypothetical protein [Rhodopirellula sp. MGV]|uniref:hypothetical protein n=1 Tax=Rhodopirellula sp. MGV TaxID=2023130 RepID=UPI000B970078|nr:hypothetical protein [Rhodopirellula sp. MGV]OYP37110.1 hypothetical protein CGZ80_06055 [Rhodopirellula sp. MGV]PNY34399.1 hypothetical protein C2E31_23385 [Rhodopirellula baltica]
MRQFGPLIALVCFLLSPGTVHSQDYELVEPSGVVTSELFLTGSRMVSVERNGDRYYFRRDPSLDSMNGRYLGYWLPSMNRIVRFPRSGSGPMQVADLDDTIPGFLFSRRQVRPFHHGGHHPVPFADPFHAFHPPVYWGRRPGRRGPGYWGPGYWGPGYYRPWGFPAYGYLNQGLTLNVFPGYAVGGATLPWAMPQSTVISSRVITRAPLPPVNVAFENTTQREVRVTLVDKQSGKAAKQFRIRPGQSVPIELQRDAGADRVQEIETLAADGSWGTRQVSTPIPPSPRYEVVVHEWRLQSIAIDRTGKSPNPIEDTNYQGRGLGRFELPAGDHLHAGKLDVVQAALSAENAGSVSPIFDDKESSGSLRPLSPLEQMLLQQQNR